jgi:hypothetical protein
MELISYFQKFLSNIEPTANQKDEAATGHTTLRSRLKSDEEYKTDIIDSFLSGSYGRQTAIRPIKDVDIIIVTNYKESDWEPSLALSRLKRILSKYYDNLETQNRSINISLSYVNMDIVPAVEATGDFLKIPDREVENWVLTNPRRHIRLSSEMNASKNCLYKPLVKTIKWWRDNRMSETRKPKSFLLECLVYEYGSNHSINSLPQAVENLLWTVYQKYKINLETKHVPFISDFGGTRNDVAKKWTYQEFEKFILESKESWHLAYRALKSEDKEESIEKWRQLLGNTFPTSV